MKNTFFLSSCLLYALNGVVNRDFNFASTLDSEVRIQYETLIAKLRANKINGIEMICLTGDIIFLMEPHTGGVEYYKDVKNGEGYLHLRFTNTTTGSIIVISFLFEHDKIIGCECSWKST